MILTQTLSNLKKSIIIGSLNWADGLLFVAVVFWGINISLVKLVLPEMPPLVFNGLRFLLVCGLMLLLTRLTGQSLKFQRRHWPYLIGLGLLGQTIYQLFFIFGVAQTTADNSALILATVPSWVALLGTWLKLEQVSGRGWAGIGLSFVGIVLIILGNNHAIKLTFGGATLWGDALILGATLCWSLYTVALRPMLRHYAAISVTAISAIVGAIPLILIAVPSLSAFRWGAVSVWGWLGLIFSGTCSITLAYFFWNYGIVRLGSARTSLYSNLTPFVTLLVAWLWLGETLTFWQVGGGVLALVGVALARQLPRPE
jgi:drug/metabolite transporter (DMT)-like permease